MVEIYSSKNLYSVAKSTKVTYRTLILFLLFIIVLSRLNAHSENIWTMLPCSVVTKNHFHRLKNIERKMEKNLRNEFLDLDSRFLYEGYLPITWKFEYLIILYFIHRTNLGVDAKVDFHSKNDNLL